MLEISLGPVNITERQQARFDSLRSALVDSFHWTPSDCRVFAARALTEAEKQSVRNSLLALSDEPFGTDKDKQDFVSHPLKGLTAQQAESWIDANVVDLASAKAALKRIVTVLVFLVNRSDLK